MSRSLVIAALASAVAACGSGSSTGALLAGAPREADLAEPSVDRARLRPELFRTADGGLAVPVCDTPLEYALGDVDERFGLGRKQALAAIARAVGYWERDVGRALFLYNPDSAFTIDFVFDERQEMAIKRHGERDPLDEVMARYRALEAERNEMLARHAEQHRAYEDEVARWNEQGGAPPDVKERLDAEKDRLLAMAELINDVMRPRVNALATDINTRDGSASSLPIIAGKTWRETRDGLVTRLDMDIFMFDNWDQLALIIGHELGHALGLGHVESRGSMMYGGTNPQRTERLTPDDLAELRRVCP